jgi:hypothetical protein
MEIAAKEKLLTPYVVKMITHTLFDTMEAATQVTPFTTME